MPYYCSRCGTESYELAGQCERCGLTFSQPGLKSTQPPPSDVRGVSVDSSSIGFGCGGKRHSQLETCRICNRRLNHSRLFPYPQVENLGSVVVLYTSRLRSCLCPPCGILLIAVFIAISWKDISKWADEWTMWRSVNILLTLLAPLIGGVALVLYGLFTRRVIALDPKKGAIVDSKRSLFTRPIEISYSYSETAWVGLETFKSRHWENGKLKSESPESNTWLEMKDGRIYSFGPGEPDKVRSLAKALSDMIGVPLTELDPASCPTQDFWDKKIVDSWV